MNDPEQIAREMADAARRGENVASLVRDAATTHGLVESYRAAAGLIWEANQIAHGDAHLLVDDDALGRIMRVFRRDDALAALYEADQRGIEPILDGVSDTAAELAASVWDARPDLDRLLEAASTGWRVHRMPPVDRTVLRIALFELMYQTDTPTGVIVSEAVRLAKAYSTEKSGAFVNGVLSRLAESIRT